MACFLVLLAAFAACKEEYTQHDIHVRNPYSDTDPTDPAADDDDGGGQPAADATTTTDASADAALDAKPADARADARDATGQ